MGKELIQFRVPDEMSKRADELVESGEYLNRSDGLRDIFRAGLEAKEADTSDGDGAGVSVGDTDEIENRERAEIDPRVRVAGGGLMLVMLALVTLSEFGMI